MQKRITAQEIGAAAKLLAKHEKGRAAMKHLAAGLSSGDLDLDLLDQRAFLALLGGAWLGQSEQVCEIVNAALGDAGACEATPSRAKRAS